MPITAASGYCICSISEPDYVKLLDTVKTWIACHPSITVVEMHTRNCRFSQDVVMDIIYEHVEVN